MVNLEPTMTEGEAVVEDEPCWMTRGGSKTTYGEREPDIQGWIKVEQRLRAPQELNPSYRCHLDQEYRFHPTIRALEDLHPLGDLQPSLCYRN